MPWKLISLWRDHTFKIGRNKGRTSRAHPLFSKKRGGYDIYPQGSNELKVADLVNTIDDVYYELNRGKGVRCIIPETGDDPILYGHFCALFEQD
jgi:hypothetical protein